MSANQQPIYTKQGEVSSNAGSGVSANMAKTINLATASDATGWQGTDANNQVVFTANTTNGGFIQRLRFKPAGTTVATVARIYLNNGGDFAGAANNSYYGDQSLPAVSQSLTSGTVEIDYPMNIALNPGFQVVVGLGTKANTVGTAGLGWVVTAVGGVY